MADKCAACGALFAEGDCIQNLPPLLHLKKGGKSGQLGWYTEGSGDTETVHVECVQQYFNVDDSPLWETIENSIRERVMNDERNTIREEALEEFLEDGAIVCRECMEELHPTEAAPIMASVAENILGNADLMVNRMPYEKAYRIYEALGRALSKKAQVR
jgi:hypothetical protein